MKMSYSNMENTEMACDLLVISATLEGCIAAFVAAKKGYSVILTENSGSLGGLATNGLYSWFQDFDDEIHDSYIKDVRNEILKKMNLSITDEPLLYQEQKLKVVLAQMLSNVGVTILTHVFTSSPLINNNKLQGFKVYGKSGCIDVYAKAVIDASDKMDTACFFKTEIDQHTKPVSVAIKLNNVNFNDVAASSTEIYTNNSKYIISLLKMPFSYDYDDMKLWVDELLLLGNKKYGELIVHGLSCNSTGYDPVRASMIQMRMHSFAYKVLDCLQDNIKGFDSSHIIQVSPRMNVYGLRSINYVSHNNLLYCNNDIIEYSNNYAIGKGIEVGNSILPLLS